MTALSGKRILVVEDEALIAAMLEDMLIDLGATVVGPAATLTTGLGLARGEVLDGAILDANLNGVFADPIAEALAGRGVPFVFASGYGRVERTERFGMPVVEKPYAAEEIEAALIAALKAEIPPAPI